jgi:acyl carrier protein
MVRKHYSHDAAKNWPGFGRPRANRTIRSGRTSLFGALKLLGFVRCHRPPPPTEASKLNQSQILDEVADIIRDVLDTLDDKSLKITAETTADQTEGWDSFNHINIVVAVEQHFGVKFKTAEIESLRNVGELVALIAQKLKSR